MAEDAGATVNQVVLAWLIGAEVPVIPLVGAVQEQKSAALLPERDLDREQEIVERLSRQAPRLGEQRVDRLVHAIIEECLDAVPVRPEAAVA